MEGDKDLKSLHALIAAFGGAERRSQGSGPSQLLLEHLQAARRALLGSSRSEYVLNLEQAKWSLAAITDNTSRIDTSAALQSLIDSALARHTGLSAARAVNLTALKTARTADMWSFDRGRSPVFSMDRYGPWRFEIAFVGYLHKANGRGNNNDNSPAP